MPKTPILRNYAKITTYLTYTPPWLEPDFQNLLRRGQRERHRPLLWL